MSDAASSQSGAPLERLLGAFQLGPLTLKNRIVMSPMAAISPEPDGRPSAQTIAFLEARARGGVGLIIVGGTIASQRGFEESPFKGIMRADVEAFTPDLARVAAASHAHGVPIIAEIMPGFGRMAAETPDRPLIAASPVRVIIPKGKVVPIERVQPVPREATIDEIKAYEQSMIDSALRLQRANWDGVEVAAHMSYFLASFLSARTNLRRDEYGGSVENRARVLTNIIRGIRAGAGPGFAVGLRIISNEYVAGGQDAKGYAAIAREVEQAAGLDWVAPTPGCYESMNETSDAKSLLIGNGDMAAFREALSTPLILGGVHDPDEAEQAIASGHGDLIMLARQMLADPAFANKLKQGRRGEIVKCDLNGHCMSRLMLGMPVRCSLNPAMGREAAVAAGAPLHDRSFQRLTEDAIIRLTMSKPVLAIAGALSAGGKRSKSRVTEQA